MGILSARHWMPDRKEDLHQWMWLTREELGHVQDGMPVLLVSMVEGHHLGTTVAIAQRTTHCLWWTRDSMKDVI